MKVAIATDNGFVAQHFGKCSGFLIVDIENGNIVKKVFVENLGHKAHQPGAVPRFLRSQNVDCVIAGGMGTNAMMNLQSSGIKVIVGVAGAVDEVLNKFVVGSLSPGESLCEHKGHRRHRCKH